MELTRCFSFLTTLISLELSRAPRMVRGKVKGVHISASYGRHVKGKVQSRVSRCVLGPAAMRIASLFGRGSTGRGGRNNPFGFAAPREFVNFRP